MPADQRVVPLLLWGLTVILFVALTAWFLENFERRTELIEAGASAEARRNEFLAAERFLRRIGIEARSIAGRELLRELPDTGDVLVVNGLSALNNQRRAALEGWLTAGGRLVTSATRLRERFDDQIPSDFLAGFGVQLHELDDTAPDETVIATVEFPGYPETLELELNAGRVLFDASESATGLASAGKYYRLLQYRNGEGQLTVTSDLEAFSNARIGERDHALFLALLTVRNSGGKVWLLYDSGVPWLGALVWRHAPYALVGAACLILAVLWHLGGRLGPLQPRPEPGSRDLLAHLQALADFHWRHGRASHLIRGARARVEQAWLRLHPALRNMEPSARADWIAQHAGLPKDDVRSALYSSSVDDRSLVHQTQALQRLWSALSTTPARR
jgi:hypothetical protein